MRIVAKRAIFLNRWVVADERAAFFHMAGITSVVNAIPHHAAGSRRAVRIMAIGANYFSFPGRMAGGAVDLCTLFFMTGKTYFRLRDAVAYFVLCGMYLVTGGAGDITIGMGTADPMHLFAALVTA